MKLIHLCIALSLAGVVSPAIAAQQSAQRPVAQTRAQDPEPVTGEVLSVDDKTTVTYRVHGTTHVAIKIELKPKK